MLAESTSGEGSNDHGPMPESHHNLRAASAFAISFRTPYLWNETTKKDRVYRPGCGPCRWWRRLRTFCRRRAPLAPTPEIHVLVVTPGDDFILAERENR